MSYTYPNLFNALAPYGRLLIDSRDIAQKALVSTPATINRHGTYGALESVSAADSTLDSVRSTLSSVCSTLASQFRNTFNDRTFLVDGLSIPPNATQDQLVAALYDHMVAVNVRLFGQVVTIDPVGATPTFVTGSAYFDQMDDGSGTFYGFTMPTPRDGSAAESGAGQKGPWLLIVPQLDGNVSPRQGVTPRTQYNAQLTQFTSGSETLVVECRTDSQVSQATAGFESWGIYTRNTNRLWEANNVGSGSEVPLASAYAVSGSLVSPTDSQLANWTAGVPNGWTVVTGTGAGLNANESGFATARDLSTTDFYQNDDATTGIFRSGTSIRFKGSSQNVDVELTRPLSINNLRRNSVYILSWWEYLHSGTAAPAPYVRITGAPGVVAVGQEEADVGYEQFGDSLALSAYSTGAGWRFRSRIYKTKASITGTPLISILAEDSGASTSITGILLTPVQYHAGLGFVVIPGHNNPLIGNRFTINVSTAVGNARWSRLFAETMGVQFPILAVPGGSPTTDSFNTLLDTDLTTVPASSGTAYP